MPALWPKLGCIFMSGAFRNLVADTAYEAAVQLGLVTHLLQRMGRGVHRDGSSSALVPKMHHRVFSRRRPNCCWNTPISARDSLCRLCESDT